MVHFIKLSSTWRPPVVRFSRAVQSYSDRTTSDQGDSELEPNPGAQDLPVYQDEINYDGLEALKSYLVDGAEKDNGATLEEKMRGATFYDVDTFREKLESAGFRKKLQRAILEENWGRKITFPPCYNSRCGKVLPGGTFPSVREAARFTGWSRSEINRRLNSREYPDWRDAD